MLRKREVSTKNKNNYLEYILASIFPRIFKTKLKQIDHAI